MSLASDAAIAALLGLLQGVTEWLPVSSEGVVAAAYSFILNRNLEEAVAYALWLHLGTVLGPPIIFRREVSALLAEFIKRPRSPSPLFRYLLVSTLVSGLVGLPLLIALGELSQRAGAGAMAVIGGLMLVTGSVQLRQPVQGSRNRADVSVADAVLAGMAQGLAALPGLSRSGLTVAILLARRIDRREALVLSFLMSVPASLGAALYAALDSGITLSRDAIIAVAVAAIIGLATMRILLAIAQRINFGAFVLVMGIMILSGVWLQFAL